MNRIMLSRYITKLNHLAPLAVSGRQALEKPPDELSYLRAVIMKAEGRVAYGKR